MINFNGLKVKVENFNGKANQFLIEVADPETGRGGLFFQSYKTVIAFRPFGLSEKTVINPNFNQSQTTNKYRCQFLGESGKETEEKIKAGIYETRNLN